MGRKDTRYLGGGGGGRHTAQQNKWKKKKKSLSILHRKLFPMGVERIKRGN